MIKTLYLEHGFCIRIITFALVVLVVMSGCVSDSLNYKWDNPKNAKLMGFNRCKVSLPLTEADVLAGAVRWSIVDPVNSNEWKKVKASQIAGDELRYVDCSTVGKDGIVVGIVEFVLVRNSTVVAEVFRLILD